jgi:PHD/YefM family antitoxin component YafN of YafNO toxin-antitoxin module
MLIERISLGEVGVLIIDLGGESFVLLPGDALALAQFIEEHREEIEERARQLEEELARVTEEEAV